MRIKKDPFAYWHLPLYFYLARTYFKFQRTGQCLDFPLRLQIQTLTGCNGQCSICPYHSISKNLVHGTMTRDLHSKIVDEAIPEQLLCGIVYELHNEPLLDKRTFEFIKYFKSKSPGKEATLVTNGELLDRFTLTDILLSNLDCLIVSLNAYSKEMFERINCGLDYEKVMRNISFLLSNKEMRKKVILSFIFTEQNQNEVYQAVRFWNKMGVATRVLELTNRAGTLPNYDSLRSNQGYYAKGYFSRLRRSLVLPLQRRAGCQMPFYQMNVLFNGDVIICCNDWNRSTVVGNAKESSLREIWNSDKFNRIRRLIVNKNYKAIESCSNCSFAAL